MSGPGSTTSSADTDPGDGGGGGVSPGSGGGATGASGMLVVLSKTITLPVAGVVDVDGAALQSFSPGNSAWRFELWIDGELVWAPSGTAPGDVVAIGGTKFCTAGDRLVELRWAAATNITLKSRYLKIRGFNNVAG